jgi:hypothetical protein
VTFCSTSPFPAPSSYTSYIPMDYFATEFYDRKDALVIAEMQILKRLGFQTQCALPYGHLVNYLQVLELAGQEEVVSKCWGYLNDMYAESRPSTLLRTDIRVMAGYKLLSQLCTLNPF